MTNQLKLKKPLEQCDFEIRHQNITIEVMFDARHVRFKRLRNYKNEGTCVYRYETPEKGEEFIYETYRQVVERESLTPVIGDFVIASDTISNRFISTVSHHPIPRQEFFSQLRERLKEIVEVVKEPSLEADRIRYAVQEAIGKGYKITIERE